MRPRSIFSPGSEGKASPDASPVVARPVAVARPVLGQEAPSRPGALAREEVMDILSGLDQALQDMEAMPNAACVRAIDRMAVGIFRDRLRNFLTTAREGQPYTFSQDEIGMAERALRCADELRGKNGTVTWVIVGLLGVGAILLLTT